MPVSTRKKAIPLQQAINTRACRMLGGVGEGTGEYVGVSLEAGALPACFQVKVILFNSDE